MVLPLKTTKNVIKECLPLQLNIAIKIKYLLSWQAKT